MSKREPKPKKPKPIPLSQMVYNTAPVEEVLAVLSTEPRAFEDICVRLGAEPLGPDQTGLSRGAVMVALHRLVKEERVERSRDGDDAPVRYALAEDA